MFSAKKQDGQPLYKLARKGKIVEREPRFIRVTQFELNNINLPESDFVLHCSKGTYVRTIIHDLGEKIGCGGHLTALRRTETDKFHIRDAKTLDELKAMANADLIRQLIPPLPSCAKSCSFLGVAIFNQTSPVHLAIGIFDGVHPGHREILGQASRASKRGWRACCSTHILATPKPCSSARSSCAHAIQQI